MKLIKKVKLIEKFIIIASYLRVRFNTEGSFGDHVWKVFQNLVDHISSK